MRHKILTMLLDLYLYGKWRHKSPLEPLRIAIVRVNKAADDPENIWRA